MVRKVWMYVCLVVLLVVVLEGISWLGGRYLQSKSVFYTPTVGSDYQGYLDKRDAVLGWPSPATFGQDGARDASGSRIIPAFADPEHDASCVSLYGDSFTWSSEVDHEHAWSNVLSTLLGCRVANYGVPGYGTDQAYLRFLHQPDDGSDIILLGHLSADILRNVNQYRDLLYPGRGYGFKPRFVLAEDGGLRLIPLPRFSEQEYPQVAEHPEAYLAHEHFLPGGRAGVQRLRFPYTWSLLRAFSQFHVRAKLAGKPWYLDFYEADHESKALEVTLRIITAFYQEATARGKTPIIVFIPTSQDFEAYYDTATWSYQGLLDTLVAQGTEHVIHVGNEMISRIDQQAYCDLFIDCERHYNETGYALLAEIVYAYLLEKQL